MAGSYEHQLICKILEQQDLYTPMRLKVTKDSFASQECRSAYSWLVDQFRKPTTYGYLPSWQLFSTYFPSFPWCGSNDRLEVLADHVRTQRLREELHRLATAISDKADADPKEALSILRERGVLLGGQFSTSKDILISSAFQRIWEDYNSTTDAITGIPFPWDYLSFETQGKQPGDYVVAFGRPGNMKSWLFACVCAAYSYIVAKRRVLVWSMEMDPYMLIKRTASVITMVDYDKFRKRQLDPAVAQQMFSVLQHLQAMEVDAMKNSKSKPALLITKPDEDRTLSALHAKVQEFEPDEVYIDGVYLMQDEQKGREHRGYMNISRGIKNQASQFSIPYTVISQQNRPPRAPDRKKGKNYRVGTEDMAFSDAFGQDADLGFHVERVEGPDEVIITATKGREAKIRPIVVNAKPSVDFTFKRYHSEEDDSGNSSSSNVYTPDPSWAP